MVLDIRGIKCPMVTYEVSKEIKKLDSGDTLEVLANDPGAKKDVPAWSRVTGNELLETTEDEGVIRFFIKKK